MTVHARDADVGKRPSRDAPRAQSRTGRGDAARSQAPPEVVVITGASAGVGRATVREFARAGAAIGLLARNPDGLEGARREVAEAGGRPLVLPTDVADPAQVEAAAERVEQELGPIDIWINNAMTTVFGPVWSVEPEEFRRVTEVTYLGAVHGTQAALRRMRPRNRGRIVQVGSALSYRAIPLQSAYCGAKHALRGFTDSLRTELMHESSRVSVTMVQLPGLNTPQFDLCRAKLEHQPRPMAPVYQPEVAARAIYKAAHGRRRESWVRASTTLVVLGQKFMPGLTGRYLARNAVAGQLTGDRLPQDRPDDLFAPVPGDHGAHGRFDEQARD